MLINGQSIEIEDEDEGKEIIELLKEFGNYLDNEDMKYFFHEKTEKRSKENNEISKENIKEMIQIYRQYNKSSEQEKVLNFLSRNFYRISEFINIEYLNENELEIILSSPELKIESEDCLFDFISSFELPKYCFLFDYINVEYLSNEKMQEMLDIINNYEMTFHHQLWKSICRRLVMNSKQMNKNQNPRTIENKQETIECSKGIIDYLRNESNINNNPYESKLIEVETLIIKRWTN